MLEIGSIVDGKYKILNKIGQGGMSVVYLAMNERANKQWAIKEVRKDGTKDYEVVRQGLIAETDILKKLNHPHLPSIIDVIDCDDTFLIVMDYIEGKTLDYWLKHEGAQPQERVVEWAKQICDVLGYLHSRKPPIIYRDLKPSNVMLKPDGQIMIIDFGTAREFKERSIEDTACLGTQGYAAPEQYGGHGQTDGRTDIYTLGATMYHLLTGHNPSLPPYEMYPIRKWNPSLSSGLEEIVLKCTQRNPADRYQTCAELMYALEHYDEMDIEYKKTQGRKWKLFLTTASLTAFFLVGTIGFKVAEVFATKNSYDGYITAAATSATQEEKVEYYRDAINLDPSREDAWMDLVDQFVTSEGQFSQEEDVQIKEILGYTGSGSKSNESYLKGNRRAYDEFAYEMGLAYFYYYGDSGNKAMSRTWFETAADSGTLDDNKVERAKRFARVAQYYDSLNVPDRAGDRDVTYQNYWDDLVELTSGNLVELDNKQTALVMYNELALEIIRKASDFRTDGVTQSELEAQLQKVKSSVISIKSDAESGTGQNGDVSDSERSSKGEILDKDTVLANIAEAEQKIEIAYSAQSMRTGGDESAGD